MASAEGDQFGVGSEKGVRLVVHRTFSVSAPVEREPRPCLRDTTSRDNKSTTIRTSPGQETFEMTDNEQLATLRAWPGLPWHTLDPLAVTAYAEAEAAPPGPS